MTKNTRNLIEAIQKGKEPEIALPGLGSQLASVYYRMALMEFAMNYAMVYEAVYNPELEERSSATQADGNLSGEIYECLQELQQEVAQNLMSGFDGQVLERSVEELARMREEIIRRMEVLTAYTDILEIYEYVLNRIEANYLQDEVLMPSDEELNELADRVFKYVFGIRDNVIINTRIQEVLGQLPVRMTKQKFFDLVKDSLSIYQGSDSTALDLYEYMIRTGAMLYRPEGMSDGTYYSDLQKLTEELSGLEFEKLTKEQFEAVRGQLDRASDFIVETSENYMTMTQAINSLYVAVLTAPYAQDSFTGKQQAEQIIRVTQDAFSGAYPTVTSYLEAVEGEMEQLEGKLEELLEDAQNLESVLPIAREQKNLIDSLMLRPLYDSLQVCSLLRSDSMFADIKEKENVTVTPELLQTVTERLLQDFSDAFAKQGRMVRRAMMAATLSRMPVFFLGQQDTADYIRGTLLSCSNAAELWGTWTLLENMMEMNA